MKYLLLITLLFLISCSNSYIHTLKCEEGYYSGRVKWAKITKHGTWGETINGDRFDYSPGVKCSYWRKRIR